jgi:cell division control protein 45
MDMSLKQSLRIKVDSIAPEYGLFDLAYPSFVRASGYQSVLSASDSVEAVGALLEVGTAVRLDFGREEGFKTWGAYVSGEEDNKENAAPAGGQVQQANGGHAGVARQPLGEKDQVVEDPDAVVVRPEDQWWVRNFWLAWNALGEECVVPLTVQPS